MKNELGLRMSGDYTGKGFPYNTPTFANLISSLQNHLPMKMEQTECSETSAQNSDAGE